MGQSEDFAFQHSIFWNKYIEKLLFYIEANFISNDSWNEPLLLLATHKNKQIS